MKKKLVLITVLLLCSTTIYKYNFAASNKKYKVVPYNPEINISLQNNTSIQTESQIDKTNDSISDMYIPISLNGSQETTTKEIDEESVALVPHQIVSIQSSMDIPTNVPTNPNYFYLYTPEIVFSNTPVIIACHGYSKDEEEMSGFGNGNFALYLKVYQGYHPNAVIVFPCKDYNGDWIPDNVVNLTNSFIQTYQFTGPVYYYGFSQGCLNGPDIISQYGKFKAAVFVDEDFLATPYPDKNGSPLGVKKAATLLSSLSALRIAGCTYVDKEYERMKFANILQTQGITYNEEIYPKDTFKHLEVHELTVISNIEWLLNL